MTIAALLDNMLIAWSHIEGVTVCAGDGVPQAGAAAQAAAAATEQPAAPPVEAAR